jgi:hypothetical protein
MSAGGIVIDITVGIACLAPYSRTPAGIGWPQALATCQKNRVMNSIIYGHIFLFIKMASLSLLFKFSYI